MSVKNIKDKRIDEYICEINKLLIKQLVAAVCINIGIVAMIIVGSLSSILDGFILAALAAPLILVLVSYVFGVYYSLSLQEKCSKSNSTLSYAAVLPLGFFLYKSISIYVAFRKSNNKEMFLYGDATRLSISDKEVISIEDEYEDDM